MTALRALPMSAALTFGSALALALAGPALAQDLVFPGETLELPPEESEIPDDAPPPAPADPFAAPEGFSDPFAAPGPDGFAPDPDDEFRSVIEGERAVLRALNKVTAFTQDFFVGFDDPLEFGSLTVLARYCSRRPPELIPETFVFLEIYDRGFADPDAAPGEYGGKVFSGWMLGSSPALHGLEHPVYDIWPVGCETAEEAEATDTLLAEAALAAESASDPESDAPAAE